MSRDPLPPEWGEDVLGRADGFPLAPWNTWSNAAYLVAAGFCALQSLPGIALAVALSVLAIGSAGYHGTAEPRWQSVDRAGMHMVFVGLAVHGIAPTHPATPYVMLALGAAAAFAFVFRAYVSLDACMAIYLVTALVSASLRGSLLEAGLTLALFANGFLAWTLDQRAARPLGKYGHAIWHMLTAAAIALLFRAQP